MTTPSSTTFFSTSDLARLLQISPQRVHKLVQDGKIPAPEVRVGRATGYSPETAAQILAARRAQAPGDPWAESSNTSYRGRP